MDNGSVDSGRQAFSKNVTDEESAVGSNPITSAHKLQCYQVTFVTFGYGHDEDEAVNSVYGSMDFSSGPDEVIRMPEDDVDCDEKDCWFDE